MLINQVFRAGTMKTMHWILQYRMQNLRTRSSLTRRGGRGKGLTIVHVCQPCSAPPCYLPCFSFFFCSAVHVVGALFVVVVVGGGGLFWLYCTSVHPVSQSSSSNVVVNMLLFFLFVWLLLWFVNKKVYKSTFSSDNSQDPSHSLLLFNMNDTILLVHPVSFNKQNDEKSRHRMNDMSQESNAAEIVTFWTILQEASNNIVLQKVSVGMKALAKIEM